ncbi:cytochrome P450 family protein [Rhizoctonia solani AG-3 Rhs1AP]|uniref:Cytochrome P450 family protein n=1 Tax=Rhizoctonia solani AG-3 Rhs1AP TaxID=1086054 RepID=X8J2M8_9AGAM|nr:cytochrome P450 family protein [Rhizoctonia solani AG-3 Rhs1AP]
MNSSASPFPFSLKLDGEQLLTNNQLVAGTVAAATAGLLWYLLRSDSKAIKQLGGWPLIGQWAFFTKRYDFLREGFESLPGETSFGFNILKHRVVALKGEEARKVFFDKKDLSFTEGYRLLFGAVPSVKDIVPNEIEKNDQEQLTFFLRRLSPLLRMDRLADLTPLFMSDIERNMASWGETGRFDPFDAIYSMVFQLTIRATGAREIADSVEKCKELEGLFWSVEMGSTPTSVLLPWLPSEARKKKVAATGEIYNLFDGIIKARRSEGRREEDALQVLMDFGDSTPEIISFIMGTLFAGIVNSGLMSAWIFIFLDQEPEWKGKVIQELQILLDRYAPVSESYGTVGERLSKIPPQGWENEMPVLEACLRETIRLIFSSALLRRAVNGDIQVGGKKIPNGSFLVYQAGETHHNPDIYPNPSKFDPGRYGDGQDKSQLHAFLGWGAGRHPCLGKRFAQYEIKAICALFLTLYDYEVIDTTGKKPDPSVTVPDKNNIYQVRNLVYIASDRYG